MGRRTVMLYHPLHILVSLFPQSLDGLLFASRDDHLRALWPD